MSRPDVRVQIAFDLAAGGAGNFFTLSDPVRGVLDNTDFVLSGDVLQDVTDDVLSVSFRRGRSKQLEVFQAGAVDVELRNNERKYDPSAGTAITPFGASMRPRKQIVVDANGSRVFTGLVDDWNLDYSLDGNHRASVTGADAFMVLANQFLSPGTVVQQLTGARVSAVLDRPEIGWPAGRREISVGKATVQAQTLPADDPFNVLEYLQQVELAEPGAFFVGKEGQLIFRDRADSQRDVQIVFSDDGSGVPFTGLSVAYGSEELRNRVTVSRLGAGTVTSVGTASVDEYGAIDFELKDSLLSSDVQAQDLADYLVNTFSEPQFRVNSLEVNLNGMGAADSARVLRLELGDVVRVKFTPSGLGDQIDQFLSVDSVEHSVGVFDYVVRFALSRTELGFVLDSPVFGVLDDGRLAF